MPYLASPMESLETLKQNYDYFNQVVLDEGLDPVKIVPVMRSIFVTDDASLSKNLKLALSESSPKDDSGESIPVDDWTIIGNRNFVSDKLKEYQEQLGVTLFVARGRFPLVSNEQQIESHTELMQLSI